MLDKDAALRPDATQCLEHPWFSGYSEVSPTLSVGVLQCVESYARMTELRKGIFLLLAHQYEVQKSALVELRALFTHFDVRNQGCLSAQDLKGVLVRSGMGGVAAERVCHALDRRRDGQITWTEFTAAAMWYVVCRNNRAIDAAFATFDSDQDGRVTARDLQMVLADLRGQEAWRKHMPNMFDEMEKQEISSLRRTARETMRSVVQMFKKEAMKYANLDQFRQYLQQNMDFRAGDALYAAPMVYPSADFVRRPVFLVRDGRDQEAKREEVQPGSGAAIGGPSSEPILDSSAVSVLLNEVQALRKAQMDVAKENVALRAQVMGLIAQSPGREEEFNTPDRGESVLKLTKVLEENTYQLELCLEGMTNLQKQIMEKDKDKDTETVRSQIELPPLPPWSSTTGPVDLSDWLVLIEPIMSDLTATSGECWCGLMAECQSWYSKHNIQLQPLDRIAHEPSPSSTLTTSKWLRLERRASTLLPMAVPPDQREELISAKRLIATKIICHLMVLYQPGGLVEKELILRQLESPPEAVNLSDAQMFFKVFANGAGCRKGRGCRFNHDLKDEKRRCYHCGSPDHLAPQCDKGNGGGFFFQKATKAQKDANKDAASSPGLQTDIQPNSNKESISSILEEANRLLKAMGGSETSEASSTTNKPLISSTTTVAADQNREDMMDKLQQQLNALRQKTLRVSLSRMSGGGMKGLINSGATHPLRPLRRGDDQALCQKVDVTLADGRKTQLLINKNGTLLTPSSEMEPIIPMGLLQSALDCKMIWIESELQVLHPTKGKLPVSTEAGCPMLPRALALDLIDEIEQSKVNVQLKGLTFDEEMRWLRQLVDEHPALRDLPGDIKAKLIATPGQWSDLPYNKRMRKRMKRDGVHLHLYAGPDDGYTLKKALEKLGAQEHQLMEIDVLRGDGHNMLHMNGVYSGLLRCAFDGKLETILGGPNCRSRSILRHVPIPEWPQAPRPVRSWGGGGFGKCDLSQSEKTMVLEDDTIMMRMVAIKDEFNLTELTFDQFHLGGECNKMTTVGGNLPASIDLFQVKRKTPPKGRIHDSKSLSRWAPGMMDAIATSLIQHGLRQEPRMAQLSWADHLKNGHIPYRRDCRICQETLQLQRPHRGVKNAISGVLSVDTAGPLELSTDVDGSEAKFLLVGALTWLVHREVPLKKSLPEEPLPEDAPSLDVILEGDKDQEEEGLGQSSSHDASGNAEEEAPRDVVEEEAVPKQGGPEEELGDFQIQVFRMTIPDAIEECTSCRVLHAAGTNTNHWAFATRYVNEILAHQRLAKPIDFPQFLAPVQCRKRYWKTKSLGPTVETVKYLFPAWNSHGHWVLDQNDKPQITRYVMMPIVRPEHEVQWQAVEPEVEDQQAVRRRIRGKISVRSCEANPLEDSLDDDRQHQLRCAQVLEEEMLQLPSDDVDLVGIEVPVSEKLKKASVLEGPEEEILQTKIIGQDEVRRDWVSWIGAAEEEVNSLLREKEAFKELDKAQVEELVRKAQLWSKGGVHSIQTRLHQEASRERTSSEGFMSKDKFFLPQKAIYGFRRSPRLCGLCRDKHLAAFVIEVDDLTLHLVPLQSEPNLWKIVEKHRSEWTDEVKLRGLLLTYVDDIFIVAEEAVREKVLSKVMKTWKTSPPDLVGEKPIKFLGMNISKDTSSMFTLEAFSDASFSPDGGPSHGCLMILLNGSAVFWRSGKCLSTAECELVEFVNTVTAGESIYVVIQELTSKIRRVGWCDSRAALGILENEGGNWRTRHLRFRSAYVRQLILSGDWLACHVPGTNMIADLGTKALSSVKLKQLKNILGMSSPPTRPRDENDPGHGASTVLPGNQLQAKRIVQILSLVASLQKAAGGEVDPPKFPEDKENKAWILLAIYTLMVIVVTLAGRIFLTWCVEIFSEKASLNALEESEGLEDDDEVQASCSRDEVPARPKHLPEPLPVLPQPDPSEPQQSSGHQEVQVPKASQPAGVQPSNGSQDGDGTRVIAVPKGRGGVSTPKMIPGSAIPKTSLPISSTAKAVGGVPAAKATQAVPVAKSGPVVRTTRYGTVYHTSDSCRFLTARGTGTFRTAQLCESCRAVMESQGREVPVAGNDLKMRAFAQTYHVPKGCNNSTHLDT
eukprot:symbB.v1.2.030822.t1/scaffold3511.1/size105743/1